MTEEVKADKPAQPSWAPLVQDVSDNPAQLVWPRDPYGFTADLRKAVAQVSGRTKGNAEKEDILIGTLMVALAHVKKRQAKVRRVEAERLENIKKAAEARKPLERFNTYTPAKA